MTWLIITDITPEEEQPVWYYFDKSENVYDGFYSKSEHGDVFYGEHGFFSDTLFNM